MKTFRQFLVEITHADYLVSREVSNDVLQQIKLNTKWKPFAVKLDVPGFSVKANENEQELELLIVDDEKQLPVVLLVLKHYNVKVPGGIIVGYETYDLLSQARYRGIGLPLALYRALLKKGVTLVSSNVQTTGSRKLWSRLIKLGMGEVFILAKDDDADRYFNRYGSGRRTTNSVLLTGSTERLKIEAYASPNIRWVLVPGQLSAIKTLALNISRE